MVASAIGALLVGLCALIGSWYYLCDGITLPFPSFKYRNVSLLGFNRNIALPLPCEDRKDTSMGIKARYSSLKAEFTYNFGLLLSEAVVPPKPVETILSINDLDRLMIGKWIILVYAEWCPNSQKLVRIFDEFLAIADKLVLEQRDKLPNIARITVGQSPRFAAATFIDKIPTVLTIEQGEIRINKFSYSSARNLLELSLADWNQLPTSYSIKLNLSRVSFYDEWSLRVFDYFGKYIFPLQETIIAWISDNKHSTYSVLITAIASLFILRRLSLTEFPTR